MQSQVYRYNGGMKKGYARIRREIKRIDTEIRNENTPHERTRAHRLNRCDCVAE